MKYGVGRKYHIFTDMHVAGHCDTVAEHTLTGETAVVSDVTVGHYDAVVTDQSAFGRLEATVDYHMLTYHIVIADGAI